MFSLVESRLDLDGALVLDLFAGSGALGIESLSRGARFVEFVERNRLVARGIRDNIEKLELDAESAIIQADAMAFVRRYSGEKYHCIFADPPYGMEGIQELPELALPHVTEEGLFVLEHDRHIRFEDNPGLLTSRSYGRSTVSLFAPD